MKTVDLLSSVNDRSMLVDVEFEIACQKASGGGLIKFVHDDGVGVVSRKSLVRSHLKKALSSGNIKMIVLGENFNADDQVVRFLFDFYPDLQNDPDLGTENRSVTIVRV